MTTRPEMLSLVADVGGTNTRVALADGAALRAGSVARFRNADYRGLGAVLSDYLARQGHPDCDGACAAVAGPVEGGEAHLTNLDWRIDASTLAEAAQAENVALLNDLQAQGHGVVHMSREKLREIRAGRPEAAAPFAPQIVIGVGTGFNIAAIYRGADRTLVTASEAGHASLPVHSPEDLSLAQFVGAKHGFADVEEVLSGRGVANIYAWCAAQQGRDARPEPAEILRGFEAATDPLAQEAAAVFARYLGIVTGDLALSHLPYGGIFLIGGVARAFAPHLARLGFCEGFLAKGRFSDLMERFSVHVVEDDFAALAGCAGYLSETAAA
jgi:glucokinase